MRLNQHPVSIHTGSRLVSVQDKGVIVDNRIGGQQEIPGDSAVIAAGFRPDRELIDEIQSQTTLEVFEAGDCIKPRRILMPFMNGIGRPDN